VEWLEVKAREVGRSVQEQVNCAEVRAFIVPVDEKKIGLEARLAKPGLGKGGRKMNMERKETLKEQTPSVPLAKQGVETSDPRTWGWVESTIWTDRMLTALGNGVKGGKWFSVIDKVYRPRTLRAAWKHVSSNRGAAGIDGVSVDRFDANAEKYLEELGNALRDGSFHPSGVKRVQIPKDNGKKRPLGIPTVKDRIVQTAIKMTIEPIWEYEFMPSSYGFRPGRGSKDALREVSQWLEKGYNWVVDADISNYFDSIPHENLMERIEGKISDGRLLNLLREYMRSDVFDGMERWTPNRGTPQGAVISPLLANIYLHDLDKIIADITGLEMVRYADDFVVLCRSEQEARNALMIIRKWVSNNGLTLHPDKTHVGDARQPGQGFEFLGYRFEAGRRMVRIASEKALRNKIRSKTRRTKGASIQMAIAELNPILRGWFGYFKHAYPVVFTRTDGFVRRRLRSIGRKHLKLNRGTGSCLNDHKRWPNSFFAELGLFTMLEAYQSLASQSR
jgi:RNA-directed DNA polymerase